jgi:hypothetical protein
MSDLGRFGSSRSNAWNWLALQSSSLMSHRALAGFDRDSRSAHSHRAMTNLLNDPPYRPSRTFLVRTAICALGFNSDPTDVRKRLTLRSRALTPIPSWR